MFQFMQELLITPKPGSAREILSPNKRRFFLTLEGTKLTYFIAETNTKKIDSNTIDINDYNVIGLNNNNTMRNFKFPSKQKERT